MSVIEKPGGIIKQFGSSARGDFEEGKVKRNDLFSAF